MMSAQTAPRLLSFDEYLDYPGDPDVRYELVDGELAAMTPPSMLHLLIAEFLQEVFRDEIRRLDRPWLCLREAGLRTGSRKSRLMDLCVAEREQAQALIHRPAVFQTPPLLAAEVVSPDSVTRDYRYKRSEYAAAEVAEYWIIDPLEDRVTVLRLEEGFYEPEVVQGEQKILSALFPGLELSAEAILER